MMSRKQFAVTSITLAVLSLMQQVHAQQSAESGSKPVSKVANAQEAAVQAEVQQVVVTGVTSGGVKRKIDSAFVITTASEEQMKVANPLSTADMMKISPGVYVESSGGQTGANIQIRGFPSGGDAPFVTLQVNGSPLFPAPTLSFLANDSTFRMDDTIERVEILRGGPSVILSNGQPGATMNFILKKGSDAADGVMRVTAGTGNLLRYDAFYGGKLADGWYGTIGGFYRTAHGVRDPGFPADDGGSVSGTLTHKIQDGEMTFYARKTDDKNAFYTGLPVLLTQSGQLSAFPGLDPLTWTPMSGQSRLFTLPDGTKGDLADGRGANNLVLGFDFDQKIDDWQVSNKMNYFSGDQNTTAMFSGPNPVSFGAQLNSLIGAANGNAAVLAAAGKAAVSGTGLYVDGSGAVDPNVQTIGMGMWVVKKKLKNFTDELRFTKEVVKDHNLTVGAYVSQYSSDDWWNLGNMMLMDIYRKPIMVTLDNGVRATNAQGFMSGCGYCIAENGNTSNRALYAADEWKINDKLTLDAGARYESQKTTLSWQSATFGNAIGSDALALYNYGTSLRNGPIVAYDQSWNLASFTAGGIYKLSKDMSVFVRANSGGQFPFFDQLRGSAPSVKAPVTHVKQLEVGFKTVGKLYSASVDVFANRLSDQFLGQSNASGQPVNTVGGSKTYGFEYELALRPFRDFEVSLAGNWQHARYQDYDDNLNPGINGKQVQRQPSSQFRLTPTYRIPLGDAHMLKLYGTWTQVGARYSDQQNTQYLPSYRTLDAGVLLQVGEKLEFRLSGTNLTNELALTEGAASRGVLVPGGVPNVSIDRPIFGRAFELSMAYRF